MNDRAADAAFSRGLVHHRAGRLEEAAVAYREALALAPGHAEALHLLGVSAHQAGRSEEAARHIEAAVRAGPETTHQHNNLGEAYRALGRHGDAVRCYRRALELDAGNAGALANLGLALEAEGDAAGAVEHLERALAVEDDPQVRWDLARTLERAGRLEEALAAYRDLLARDPDLHPARLRVGQVLLGLARHDEAVEAFEALAARHPGELRPALGAAQALHGLSRFAEAAERARDALRAAPHDGRACTVLGLALFEQGLLEEASEAFLGETRATYARDAAPETANLWRSQVTRTKLRHDLEQYAHLGEGGVLADAHALVAEHRAALAALEAAPQSTGPHFAVAPDSALAPRYNRIVNDWRAPTLGDGALSRTIDREAIERRFADSPGAYAWLDGLLGAPALAALQRYCTESSVWLETKFRDEVGASLRNGFACPLLLQIAAEVREAFPAIFGGLPLVDVFAYKYYQDEADGHVHADIGAASVNFWVTPDEANLDPDSGGLVIWNKRVPNRYFRASASEKDAIERDLVSAPDAIPERIGYRCNRAMLFRSSVLHKSDRMRFRDAFAYRRVSVTMVFGNPPQD